MIERIFTFGYGQTCPFTGKDLGDHYAVVATPDASAARLMMLATFGRQWCDEYDGPEDPRIADYMGRMTEHARLVLDPLGLARQPDPST